LQPASDACRFHRNPTGVWMEAQLTLVFDTCTGKKERRIFTEQPLGMQFKSQMPITIKSIREGSQAEQLDVQLGWELRSVGDKLVKGMTIGQAIRMLRESAAPLRKCMVVRHAPLDALSAEELAFKLKKVDEVEVVTYLKKFTFHAANPYSWEKGVEHPELRLGIVDGHRKHSGCKHTWYVLIGKIAAGDASVTQQWQLERRLAHVRVLLHDPVKRELGNAYNWYFESSHFAHYGGPSGTTARMGAWLAALSKAINVKALTPILVAHVMRFLETPLFVPPKSEPSRDVAVNAKGIRQQEDKEGEKDEVNAKGIRQQEDKEGEKDEVNAKGIRQQEDKEGEKDEEDQEESRSRDVSDNESNQGTVDDIKLSSQASSSSEAEHV